MVDCGSMEKTKDENKIQLGKFFYSLSGMVFAGVILTIFMNYDESKNNTLLLGFAAMLVLGIIAWTLVKRGNIKKVRI